MRTLILAVVLIGGLLTFDPKMLGNMLWMIPTMPFLNLWNMAGKNPDFGDFLVNLLAGCLVIKFVIWFCFPKRIEK